MDLRIPGTGHLDLDVVVRLYLFARFFHVTNFYSLVKQKLVEKKRWMIDLRQSSHRVALIPFSAFALKKLRCIVI